jgi:two-component system, response regulator YesN
VGETPIQYLINLRMDEARRLMVADSDLDIKQIGEIVGYADPHYFSRIFKSVHGMTPTEYRNRGSRRQG